jgi:hypothetical protein
MIKKLGLLSLTLVLGVILAGCQQQTAAKSQDQPINPAAAATTSLPAASDLKPEDETALITLLAARDKSTSFAKYQLHDTQVQGDWVRGSFSVDNNLQPDMFWATKIAGAWQLVVVGQDPDCVKLAGFPTALKAGCRENLNLSQISNFADCLKAGFKATTDQPRRCLDSAGDVFLEVPVAGVAKRYISQDVSKCSSLDFECASDEKPFLDDKGCGCQK